MFIETGVCRCQDAQTAHIQLERDAWLMHRRKNEGNCDVTDDDSSSGVWVSTLCATSNHREMKKTQNYGIFFPPRIYTLITKEIGLALLTDFEPLIYYYCISFFPVFRKKGEKEDKVLTLSFPLLFVDQNRQIPDGFVIWSNKKKSFLSALYFSSWFFF